jgi:predicted butyrate kinase (DUF1464 family)
VIAALSGRRFAFGHPTQHCRADAVQGRSTRNLPLRRISEYDRNRVKIRALQRKGDASSKIATSKMVYAAFM